MSRYVPVCPHCKATHFSKFYIKGYKHTAKCANCGLESIAYNIQCNHRNPIPFDKSTGYFAGVFKYIRTSLFDPPNFCKNPPVTFVETNDKYYSYCSEHIHEIPYGSEVKREVDLPVDYYELGWFKTLSKTEGYGSTINSATNPNWRYGIVWHLFQGRYKAILCDRDRYLLTKQSRWTRQ